MANSSESKEKVEVVSVISSETNSAQSSTVVKEVATNENCQVTPPFKERHKSLTSPILSPQDIAQEILERSQKKNPQRLPEGGDVIFTMKLTQRLAKRVVKPENSDISSSPPLKMSKIKAEVKSPDLDARELLSILQDGAESHYSEKIKPKPKTVRSTFKSETKLDPELEKKLALKQLMEFSRKRGRSKKVPEDNNNVVSTHNSENKIKKRVPLRKENRELQKLLQDEGAINMLYSIEKGNDDTKEKILPSKRRMKKALIRKAQEVKAALLGGGTSAGLNLRHRNTPPDCKIRKQSVDSVDSEHSERQETFTFTTPAEASKIIRRHSSSSSYSSRSSSPRRLSIEHDRSPVLRNNLIENGQESKVILQSNKIDSSPSKPRLCYEPQKKVKEEQQKNDACFSSPSTSSNLTTVRVSERTEKLIEMKCKELKLQPEHSEIIKKMIQQKKNGLKERLQSEFASKLKAGISKRILTEPKVESSEVLVPTPSTNLADTCGESNEVSSTEKQSSLSPSKSPATSSLTSKFHVWKMVEEDWSTGDDGLECEESLGNGEAFKSSPESRHCPISEIASFISKSAAKGWARQLETGKNIYKELQIQRIDSLVHVKLAPVSTILPYSFNSQVLRELATLLEELSEDSRCRVVLLSSGGASRGVFSPGLDLPALLHSNPSVRRTIASQTANALKECVWKLAMMRKVVMAGVAGSCVGLATVLLAYCDLVLASPVATFHTPYTSLGYLPEAAATVALTHAIGTRWASSLLLGGRKLTAEEAEQCGLVTSLLPQEEFSKSVQERALSIASQSSQSMESTKALLQHNIRSRLNSVLTLETCLLQQHWVSEECQARIQASKEPVE